MTSLDSFKCLPAAQGRLQDLRVLQPAGGREERPQGHLAAAVLAEGAAREPAAQRRRPHRHQGRHPGGRALAQDQDLRPRDRLPPGARADAGFHRRAGGGRSRRHARRHEACSAAIRRRSIRWCRSISSSTIRSSSTSSAATTAFKKNVEEEYEQNQERYRFLKWAQRSFENFRVVPPGTGICHQVNLEYLSQTVWTREEQDQVRRQGDSDRVAYPDTLVGTDSHTTMVNGLRVLGWGVGGIEAEAAMLGQPYSMLLPEVIGVRFTGKLKEGVTATDLVLTVTQMLRKRGVVGKFVEFFGPGLASLTIADRATHRQHGARIRRDLRLLPDRRRHHPLSARHRRARPIAVALVEAYAKAQGMYRTKTTPGSGLHRRAQARARLGRAVARRPEAAAGPRGAQGVKTGFAEAMDKEFNKSRRNGQARAGRRPQARPRPWRRGDRRDHVLHQHLQPERDDRAPACSPARRWPRALRSSRG